MKINARHFLNMTSPEKNSTWYRICPSGDLWEGVALSIQIDNTPIAVYRFDDGVFAIEDLCPHAFALLSSGQINNGCIECPVHQALFDIRSGSLRSGPGVRDLRVFPAREAQDYIDVMF